MAWRRVEGDPQPGDRLHHESGPVFIGPDPNGRHVWLKADAPDAVPLRHHVPPGGHEYVREVPGPEPEWEVTQTGSDEWKVQRTDANWRAVSFYGDFENTHPDPERAAREEADRLKAGWYDSTQPLTPDQYIQIGNLIQHYRGIGDGREPVWLDPGVIAEMANRPWLSTTLRAVSEACREAQTARGNDQEDS